VPYAKRIRPSRLLIVDLRQLAKASHSYRVADPLLPTMNFVCQLSDYVAMRPVIIQILLLIGIIAKVVELVFIFIAQTKFPSIR
jgi:hypothetical protein